MHRPDIINYGSLRPNQHEANLNNAFNVAEESLGIAKLLDAEGIIFLNTVEYLLSGHPLGGPPIRRPVIKVPKLFSV